MKKQEKIDAFKKLKVGIKTKPFGISWSVNNGLCHVVKDIDISWDQSEYIRKMLPPKIKYSAYCWKPGVKAPRIKWINEQIKLLEGKK